MITMPDGTKVKKDLIGMVFGRLTVTGYAGRDKKNGDSIWQCLCECGKITDVVCAALKNGSTQSCGCSRRRVFGLIGDVFGKLTVLEYVGKATNGKHSWKCQCRCGSIVVVPGYCLLNGNTTSCGVFPCRPTRLIDLTGQKFGKLTVLERAGRTKRGASKWHCQCECGNHVNIIRSSLVGGNTKSCGCLKTKLVEGVSTTKHPLYLIWKGILARCDDHRVKEFPRYGGRGIKYDPSWKENFPKFVEDIHTHLGSRPSTKYSLDRIDNNGNYVIDNLQWADSKQQQINRRSTKYLNHPGAMELIRYLHEQNVDFEELLDNIKTNFRNP